MIINVDRVVELSNILYQRCGEIIAGRRVRSASLLAVVGLLDKSSFSAILFILEVSMIELINAIMLLLSIATLVSAVYTLHWIIKLLKLSKEVKEDELHSREDR